MARHLVDPPWQNAGVEDVPTGCQEIRLRYPGEVASWNDSASAKVEHADFFRDMQTSDPQAARDVAKAMATLPEVGTEFLGFRLLAELGRGGFGRVYLAQQGDLADRFVALKVAASLAGESQTLARLQHTNIVPIYSVHRAGPVQAVCMPFFGATTLAHLLKELGTRAAPPSSGKDVVSTLHDRKSTVHELESSNPSTGPSLKSGLAGSGSPVADGVQTEFMGKSTAILEKLQRLSYVDAVLWLTSRIAEGLAHAHERGVIHRDLKPANILLTDEGQPMLLDFNMADDTRLRSRASAAVVGGTLPYMSPEQFEAYRGGKTTVDVRSDIYSLGIILFELLARRHPFTIRRGPIKDVLRSMLDDRRQRAPFVRCWNPAVSPAVESIVRHCLEPDPARRYQTARELTEDIRRQLDNLPLKHAPEPSLKERTRKWIRRHPRLTSTSTVAVFAGAVILALALAAVYRGKRLTELEAKESLSQLHEDMKGIQFLLTTRTPEREEVDRGMDQARRALQRYQVLDNPGWEKLPSVRALPAEEQERLKEDIGGLLMLWARASALQAAGETERTKQGEQLQFARRLNELAGTCFSGRSTPKAVWSQRADLADMLGNGSEAKRLREEAGKTPLQTAKDFYLAAAEFVAQGQYRQALPLLQEATQQDPQNFWAWFVLGICQDGTGDETEAAASYTISIALWPKFHWAHFNRGLVHFKQRRYKRAVADFDQALRLKGDLLEAYVNRALCKQGLRDYAGAIEDFTHALEGGASYTRIYFMRARARQSAGDSNGYKKDLEEGLRREPTDEKSWVARGLALMARDPPAALADFDQALALNPRSQSALQNKAHVLAKRGRNEEAVQFLDKIIALYPDYVQARVDRGVLRARLKNCQAAHADAEEALLRDTRPQTLYQAACVFALTSIENKEDRLRAFELLSNALRRGYGFDHVETDRDLDPIRGQPEFKPLVEAARALRTSGSAKTTTTTLAR